MPFIKAGEQSIGDFAVGPEDGLERGWMIHPTFHFPRDTSGRHATPPDTFRLMLLNLPKGVGG